MVIKMSNPLYNLRNQSPSFGLPNIDMNKLNNFTKMLGANPSQLAQQLVNQIVSSGKITQEQLNQYSQMATAIQRNMNL